MSSGGACLEPGREADLLRKLFKGPMQEDLVREDCIVGQSPSAGSAW